MSRLRNERLIAVALGAALALSAPAAAEDLTIVSKVTAGGKGSATTATTYLSADKVRSSDGESDTIQDLGSGRMVFINNKKKEYYETSAAEMAAYLDGLGKEMQGNPIMEKMLGKAGEVSVTKAGTSRTIAGYECDDYTLSMGENLRFEMCAARGLEAPYQYFDARKAAYAAMGPMGKRFERMFEEMKKIKGYPLSMSVYFKMMMAKTETLSEAVEVRKGPIPASAFEVPAGYKKVSSPFKGKT